MLVPAVTLSAFASCCAAAMLWINRRMRKKITLCKEEMAMLQNERLSERQGRIRAEVGSKVSFKLVKCSI